MTLDATSVIAHEGQAWVPHNRWDLIADRVPDTAAADIAVVVPYFEQPASLARMYAALAHLDPAHVTLVVADDGSSEHPAPGPPADFPLRTVLLHQADLGCRPGAARNMAVAAVDAEILVFLDADTVPAPGTVERLAAWPTLAPDALVVGRRGHVDLTGWSPDDTAAWLGARRPPPPRRSDPSWLADGYRRSHDLLHADDRSFRYVISAVMGCHRRLFEDVEGFDGTRDEYGGDDWEFAFRAFNNGALLVHEPAAAAWHDEPDWSDRDGGSKNDESLWLATVVPEPLTRGSEILQAWPSTLVTFEFDDVPHGAVVAGVRDVVAAVPDCRVHLVQPVGGWTQRHVAHDARITADPPTLWQELRALRTVRILRPLRWNADGLRAALAAVSPDGVGQVDVADPAGNVVASVVSTRAAGRARRAPKFAGAIATLFGVRTISSADAGVTLCSGEVELAAVFDGR